MSNISSTVFADTKPHYHLLDGLRGVAALMVIWYHVFEGYAFAGGTTIDTFNHGYLAVDFFFILSGFVIGYAYDDRWGKNFPMKDFIKRRLIRLHPMVIMGAVVGAITFYIQGSVQWDGTHIGISMVMLSLLCTIFFIPAMPGVGYEVRGNGEMFPLNGPCWSLFFEYIGNILYALFIRRLSNKALTIVVVLLGVALASFAIFNVSGYGNIGGCAAGSVRLRLGLHGELAEHKLRKTGQNGDQDHADHSPGEGETLDILPRSSGQVQTQELIVHVEPAIRRGKAHFLHSFDQVDLAVGGKLGNTVFHDGGTGLIQLDDISHVDAGVGSSLDQSLHRGFRQHHEMGDRLADDGVQSNQDGKGQKAPEAAAHGIDAFLFVELLHFLLELGLVFGIALL